MSELAGAMRLLSSQFPTCVQRINYPVHQGRPNPAHGKYFFVGAVPVSCMADGKSMKYDSEGDAITAAVIAGATRIQRCDCSFVNVESWKAGLRLGADHEPHARCNCEACEAADRETLDNAPYDQPLNDKEQAALDRERLREENRKRGS